jgi:hypothetical protein
MAVRKKKAVKKAKAAKTSRKRVAAKPARKVVAKKAQKKTKAKAKKKTVVKAKAARRPVAKKAKKKAPVRSSRGEYGEGNYKASKRFRQSEEAFIAANRAKIPGMGKAAEVAMEGPEGKDLRAAEAEAASHAAGQNE